MSDEWRKVLVRDKIRPKTRNEREIEICGAEKAGKPPIFV